MVNGFHFPLYPFIIVCVVLIKIRSEDKVIGIIDAEPKPSYKNHVKSVSMILCDYIKYFASLSRS